MQLQQQPLSLQLLQRPAAPRALQMCWRLLRQQLQRLVGEGWWVALPEQLVGLAMQQLLLWRPLRRRPWQLLQQLLLHLVVAWLVSAALQGCQHWLPRSRMQHW